MINRESGSLASSPPHGNVRRATILLATRVGLALFSGMFVLAGAARADFLVAPGDVLSISVIEEPDLSREAKVGMDGQIILPHVGEVDVQGRDLDTIRQLIGDILAKRDIIRSPNVVVEVVRYRPLYIGGAVANPGSITFEPGLTVRHVLLLAGGVLADRGRVHLTNSEIVEMQARLRATRFRLLQVESQIDRLKAELTQTSLTGASEPDGGGTFSEGDIDAMRALDVAQLADIQEGHRMTDTHVQNMMALLDLEIDVLERQAVLQKQESELQNQELRNARSLFERGLIPQPRLQELQRATSRTSRDILESSAFAARARQNKATLIHELDATTKNWRIQVRQNLSEAMARRADLQADFRSQIASLSAAGVVPAGSGDDTALRPKPTVTIYRNVDGIEQQFNAELAAPVLPGDLLEVGLNDVPQG